MITYKGVEYISKGTKRCDFCGSVCRMRLNQKYCCAACRQADYRWRKDQRNAGNNEETSVSRGKGIVSLKRNAKIREM